MQAMTMQVEQVVIYFQVSIGTIFYRATNIQARLIKGYNCCRIRMNLEYFVEEACRCFGPASPQPTSKNVLRAPNPGW